MDLTQIAKRAFTNVNRNSPIILTGVAVAGVVSTAVLAVRGTYRARHVLEDIIESEEMTKQEKLVAIIRATWPAYLPVSGVMLATIASVIGAQGINSRRQAILISAVTAGERALSEYQSKVIELDDGKTHTKIHDQIVDEHLTQNPPSDALLDAPLVDGGEDLVYDDWSGSYFYSSQEQIRQAEQDINDRLTRGDAYASLNDFYSELGRPMVAGGEDIGWNPEYLMQIEFTSKLVKGGRPCVVFGFRKKPKHDYDRFH